MLLASGPEGIDRELLVAAAQGNVVQINRLLVQHANVNISDSAGQTPIQLASAKGNGNAVKVLIKHGGEVSTSDKIGGTPLMVAATSAKLRTESHWR
jgi:ankyrin repeat protein